MFFVIFIALERLNMLSKVNTYHRNYFFKKNLSSLVLNTLVLHREVFHNSVQ